MNIVKDLNIYPMTNDLKLLLPLLVPNERKKKTIKCQA